MSDRNELIAGLEAALVASPQNTALRIHLAELLMQDGQHEPALEHAETVLADDPANLGALRVAGTSGAAIGHPKAAGYQQLAAALGASTDEPVAPAPTPETPPPPLPVIDPFEDLMPQAQPVTGEGMPNSVGDLMDMWDDDAPTEPEVGILSEAGATFADVGGMQDVKDRLTTSFLAPMRNPELAAAFAKSLRGGLLLWGPPGCGKTFLARALAGELGAKFYAIGLSDVLDMYIGNSERNLTAVFEVARNNTPCLLFFDEMDALGQKRTQLRGGGGMRNVVNQFLTELDGVGKDNDGVFVLGATNHPWDVDAALLRPGRFDRKMLVLPPDEAARISILKYHMRARPQDALDFERIAKKTEGFSGADLALVCDSATEIAMTASMSSGTVKPITMRDVKKGMKGIGPSVKPWFETARNFAQYSNEGGDYDELLAYLKGRR